MAFLHSALDDFTEQSFIGVDVIRPEGLVEFVKDNVGQPTALENLTKNRDVDVFDFSTQ